MLTVLYALSAAAAPPATANEEVMDLETLEGNAKMGTIILDTRLPCEVRIDRNVVAKLFVPSRLSLPAEVGKRALTVLTNGVPRSVEVDVPALGAATVVVGRTGLTTSQKTDLPDLDGVANVEFRVAGDQDVLVSVAGDRYRVDARGYKGVTIPVGTHKMSVRSGNGTVVWATGRLELGRAGEVIVQLTEGRMPEVSGDASTFHPGG